MLRKLIGLILILMIFYFAIKALVFLPFFTNLVIGDNKSPFQVGTDYVNQVTKEASQVYSTAPYGVNSPNTQAQYRYNTNTDTKYVGKITLQKSNGKLIMIVEGSNPGNKKLNIWLTNEAQVTNQTSYIDFGVLTNDESARQYVVDMKGGDISFDEYRYVLIVDSSYKVYKIINLQ